jgi:ubiquinone/menaquinone biosynthesis C-methylase UbiE
MPDGARGDTGPEVLSDPLVPAAKYEPDYYLHRCIGSEEWNRSHGTESAPIYEGCLDRVAFRSGESLVDIGTGRGELLAVAAERGAASAVGVEYSSVAVDLVRQTLDARGVAGRAHVVLADSRALPLDDAVADAVTMLDVVEHLSETELARTLSEAYRILRPGGRMLIHTFPNRTIYDVTYRLQRLSTRRRRTTWPTDPRNADERELHVNEQTLTSLSRSLRSAGFKPARVTLGKWIYTEFMPEPGGERLYRWLSHVPGLRRFGVGDLWGEGTRPLR